jgi:hypothetical protein
MCTKDVTPEMRKFPLWKFAMFAFFDASAAFLYAIGAPNTPATLQIVIVQVINRTIRFNNSYNGNNKVSLVSIHLNRYKSSLSQ